MTTVLEVERKYFVPDKAKLIALIKDLKPHVTDIKQVYLTSKPGFAVRVRIEGTVSTLELKQAVSFMSATETVQFIDYQVANTYYGLDLPKLRKIRVEVEYKGIRLQIDSFRGKLDGLMLVEYEAPDAADFVMPEELGLIDVTHDVRFKNMNLAALDKWEDGMYNDVK